MPSAAVERMSGPPPSSVSWKQGLKGDEKDVQVGVVRWVDPGIVQDLGGLGGKSNELKH